MSGWNPWSPTARCIVVPLIPTYAVISQVAAEYFALVGQSAVTGLQILVADAWDWTTDHSTLVGAGIVLLVVVAWGGRR